MRSKRRIGTVAAAVVFAAGIAGSASIAFANADAGTPLKAGATSVESNAIAGSIADLAQMTLDRGPASQARSYQGGAEGAAMLEQAALERTVESGEVSDPDYEANHLRYVECMTNAGFAPDFRKSASGFYVQLPFRNVADTEALDAALAGCSTNTAAIDMIYRLQESNPKLIKDSRQVAVECLFEAGYVSDSYTTKDFEKDWGADNFPFDATLAGPNDCLWGAGYGYFAEGE